MLMEPGTLCSERMQWNHTPRLFKRIPTLPSLTVKPIIWDKWCDGACAYWEPTQESDDFCPGIALVVCYSPFQDLPQDNLRDKKTISMSLVYVPEHWVLPSFMEAAYMVNRTRDAKDPRGMMSLARIHKRSPFYPDISFREYKQHLMIMPLTPPTEDGLRYCRYTEDFTVGALHQRPDCFCKVGEITSWAPPAFRKAPPGELVLITGIGSKTWGYTSGTPECHNIPMAPLDSFVQLKTTEDGEPILPEYAFALCLPGSWPFASLMDQTILPESYLSEGNPGREETNANNSAKKTCKRKGKKTQRRSKSAGAASSASDISLARVKTNTQAGRNGTQQVLQELQLSSEGSDSDAPDGTGETSKGADPDNSRMGPPILPEELRVLPRTPSLDQVLGEGQDTLTLTQQEVNGPDPNTSAQDPLPMPVEQTQSPGPSIPDTSTTAASGLGEALLKDVSVIPTTFSATQTDDRPDVDSIAGVMAGLKEVCNIMTTGFQHACLDVETIVHWSLEGATQLNRRLAEAASQDLNTWASALQLVLDSAGVSDANMEARWGLTRKTGREVSNRILSLPHLVTSDPHILGEPVKSALLESFVVANAQCSHSWEEVANWVPDIMTRHVPVDQTQTFLAAVHQLLCSQYQALTTMVATQTGPPVHFGMYSWGAQASLTRSFTQVIPALGSLEHTMLANPSSSARPTPPPQEGRSARAVSADMTVYTPIPPPGSVNVPVSEFPSGTTQGSANLPICVGGNKTDSGISSMSHSTPVKPRGPDQHLTSTPKTQPKLMQAAH